MTKKKNEYDVQIRDADMMESKTEMLGDISGALVEVGGSGRLHIEVDKFIESCARNGIRLTVHTREGPYAVERGPDGRRVYT